MVSVKIGGTELGLAQADEGWINQQINRRRADGEVVCVRVRIDVPPLNMALATPTCASDGGGRPPNPDESRILDLWAKHRMNTADFTGGNLVAFLRQLERLI